MERSYRFRRRDFGARTGISSPKSRRRIRIPRPKFWTILLLVGVVGGLWFAFGSRYFRIQTIDIHGSLNESVAQELQRLKGRNLLLLSTDALEATLPKRQSSVRALHFVKGFPDTLQVDVAVREPVLIWKSGETTNFVDSEGFAFTIDDPATVVNVDSLPRVTDTKGQAITVGTQLVPKTFVVFVAGIAEKFHEKTGLSVTGITVGETARQIDVSTDVGITMKFDTTRSLDPELTGLALVLAKYRNDIHQYVDLRVEGKAFYQ